MYVNHFGFTFISNLPRGKLPKIVEEIKVKKFTTKKNYSGENSTKKENDFY